ncbi:protein phosphatase 2C domain-containing protein [Isoptericola sp. b441]|uniref:Protein phosphatase 2C domain-containing protein n=1 Tax=Actinotalea lenta TaxID=3064654 RepID=A0ABT9D7V9_9CELL|nr:MULTISPECIES: protein phosphatase 2C domain-containing protein [unclassified Isoptericola]MDO8106955.1 protein phosphatase 2C domain-containing protein [Isoptericola sp. b441]MDO8121335.1 protein phosphatase 2C domain-containing protein [Isoptericola sp. b490]
MRPTLRSALLSITGPHRSSNQDAAVASTGYALVADGVGGHAGGDVASRVVGGTVVQSLRGRTVAQVPDPELAAILERANAALAEQSAAEPRLTGLATTFTGIFAGPHGLRVAHIGDSRGYMVRGGIGSRVTHDDSYVQLLVDTGVLDPAAAWQHPQGNLLTRVLSGTRQDAEHVGLQHHEARAGDRWLLCSDGLTDYVEEPGVLRILISAAGPQEATERLLAAALAADAHDNVTVVVCDVVDLDHPGSALRETGGPEVPEVPELLLGGSILRHDGEPNLEAPAPLLAVGPQDAGSNGNRQNG